MAEYPGDGGQASQQHSVWQSQVLWETQAEECFSVFTSAEETGRVPEIPSRHKSSFRYVSE